MGQGEVAPETPREKPATIVAFDFDGTLTDRDSFTAFLKWRKGALSYGLGFAKLAPAALAYLVHRDRGRIKAAATRQFLAGVARADLEAEAEAFAQNQSLFRPDALATWARWRARGAHMTIVTASPTLVVRPFAAQLSADELIGTELAFDANDRATGGFLTANCRGSEKVRRLEQRFGPGVKLAAAYGDTPGDTQMLAIADEPGFQVFHGRP